MKDIRLLDDGVLVLTPTRGDRGARAERRFCSGATSDTPSRLAWLVLGGGWTDFALAALEFAKGRGASRFATPLSPRRLARLAYEFRPVTSGSAIVAGPIDLRGLETAWFETGG